MTTKTNCVVLFVTFLTLGLSSACNKTEQKAFQGAVLSNPQGEIWVTRVNNQRYQLSKENLQTGDGLVGQGDIIETKSSSSVDLQYDTGMSMRLGPGSKLTIQKSNLKEQGGSPDVHVKLDQGRLLTRSEKLGADANVLVQTPTMVASVRGTEFLVKPDEEAVLVDEGSVAVSNTTSPNNAEPASPDVSDPKPPAIDEDSTVVVEEGNKVEEDSDEFVVQPLDEEDRQELDELSDGLEYINADTRKHLQDIISAYESEKERIHAEFQQQLDRNREIMDAEKQKQKDTFNSEKSRITGEDARNAMDRIKNPQ
ncbi:MAG: FecR domain-containing protein [Leptospiraceae bacterium]|nr:FecR domain-containing protein [Leptospiraceae bacterium]